MRAGAPRDDDRSCPSEVPLQEQHVMSRSVIDWVMFSLTALLMVSVMVSEPHGDSVFQSRCAGTPLF